MATEREIGKVEEIVVGEIIYAILITIVTFIYLKLGVIEKSEAIYYALVIRLVCFVFDVVVYFIKRK